MACDLQQFRVITAVRRLVASSRKQGEELPMIRSKLQRLLEVSIDALPRAEKRVRLTIEDIGPFARDYVASMPEVFFADNPDDHSDSTEEHPEHQPQPQLQPSRQPWPLPQPEPQSDPQQQPQLQPQPQPQLQAPPQPQLQTPERAADLLKSTTLSTDPRFEPLGPVWLPDEPVETGKCKVAHTRIDPNFSGLTDRREHRVVQEIGKRFFQGPKQPKVILENRDGTSVKLAFKDLDFTPSADPNTMILVLIHAMCQLGKGPELKWALWGSAFVLGCMPTMQLRNRGGLGDAEVAKNDVEDMNEDISAFLDELRTNQEGTGPWGDEFLWLKREEYYKYQLEPRIASRDRLTVRIMKAPWSKPDSTEMVVRLDKPQVMICLMTPGSMKKMHESGLKVTNSTATEYTKEAMQMVADKLDYYKLFGGSHGIMCSVKKRRGRDVNSTIHSGYPAKCSDPSREYDKGKNRKLFRSVSFKDEFDTIRSDAQSKTQSMLLDSKATAEKMNAKLQPDCAAAAENLRLAKAKREELQERLDQKRKDKAEAFPADAVGENDHGGDRLFVDSAGRTLRKRQRVSYEEADVEVDEDRSADFEDKAVDSDSSEAELEGELDEDLSEAESCDPEREEEVAKAEREMEERLEEEEEAQRLDSQYRAGCSEISGENSSHFAVGATTATAAALMHKHSGQVQTSVRVHGLKVPDSYLGFDFMLPENHPNQQIGFYVKTVVLPSRLTGSVATRTDVIEEWCKRNGRWDVDEARVEPPLKKSLKGSYTIGKKMLEDAPWIADCKREVGIIVRGCKLRPSTVWHRNKQNLETVIQQGLQDRLDEAASKSQTPHGLVINNDTIRTKVKVGIMDNIICQLDDEISANLLCYSFTGEGLDLRGRRDQKKLRGFDLNDLLKVINSADEILDQVLEADPALVHDKNRLDKLVEGAVSFRSGCKDQEARCEELTGQRTDADGSCTRQIEYFSIKSKCKHPSYLLGIAVLYNIWRSKCRKQEKPLPTLGFTNSVGERAVRFSDTGFFSRLVMMYHTNDVHSTRPLTQSGASIQQAAGRINGIWREQPEGDKFMQPIYFTTEHFYSLLRNAMESEQEWARLLEAEAREDEAPTDTLMRVLTDQGERFLNGELSELSYPSLVKWLEARTNNTEKAYFNHTPMKKAETQLRITEWADQSKSIKERLDAADCPNPFHVRFSDLHGVAGNEEHRREGAKEEAAREAQGYLNDLPNIAEQVERWEAERKREKKEAAERKAKQWTKKSLPMTRARGLDSAQADLTTADIEKIMAEYQQEAATAGLDSAQVERNVQRLDALFKHNFVISFVDFLEIRSCEDVKKMLSSNRAETIWNHLANLPGTRDNLNLEDESDVDSVAQLLYDTIISFQPHVPMLNTTEARSTGNKRKAPEFPQQLPDTERREKYTAARTHGCSASSSTCPLQGSASALRAPYSDDGSDAESDSSD